LGLAFVKLLLGEDFAVVGVGFDAEFGVGDGEAGEEVVDLGVFAVL